MNSALRHVPRAASSIGTKRPKPVLDCARSFSSARMITPSLNDPQKGSRPSVPARGPPRLPGEEGAIFRQKRGVASALGTSKKLPEYNLENKVVLVSGAARGLGLTQSEALLEAGATVYALDRLEEPSPDFYRIQKRAAEELGTALHYRQIDVRDVPTLNSIIETIGNEEGRMDGLIAAAGIQQETPALEYTAEDANNMFSVNITGVFMTAQAVAKQMIKFGSGGSIVMIASMSATVANKVRLSRRPCESSKLITKYRALYVPHITPRRLELFNSVETLLLNGASMASESTPSRRATSSRLWWRSSSKTSLSGKSNGRRKTCSDA
jgi:NAD(P)-dependent dehydrogenase (short-subunit alcohol dehydrogenase family)